MKRAMVRMDMLEGRRGENLRAIWPARLGNDALKSAGVNRNSRGGCLWNDGRLGHVGSMDEERASGGLSNDVD